MDGETDEALLQFATEVEFALLTDSQSAPAWVFFIDTGVTFFKTVAWIGVRVGVAIQILEAPEFPVIPPSTWKWK